MEALLEGLNAIYEWFASGIYTFFVELWAWLSIKVMTWWFYALVWKLEFFWAVAGSIIRELAITDFINQRLSLLPQQMYQYLQYAAVPAALNIIAQAGMTKLLLRVWL